MTGGSRGIGKGIAIGLGEAGATVYVTGWIGKGMCHRANRFVVLVSGTCELSCGLREFPTSAGIVALGHLAQPAV